MTLVARLVALKRTDLLRQLGSEHPDAEVRRNLAQLLGLTPNPEGGRAG